MIYKFEPIYKERVWGGNMLDRLLGRKLPKGKVIGESWDIVDRDDVSSRVINQNVDGLTLRNIVEEMPHQILGPAWEKDKPFPILVKWLDCSKRLSLQVHPPKEIALELNAEPKTENWYIAHAQPNSTLFAGLKRGTKKSEFSNAIKDSAIDKLCCKLHPKNEDSILVQSGRIHAIGAGNLILEIQQNSDSTFRVYDWDRKDSDGKLRPLHVEESLKSIDFEDYDPQLLNTNNGLKEQTIALCEEFRIRKYKCQSGTHIKIKDANDDCTLVHVTNGKIKVNDDFLEISEHGLSPYCSSCSIEVIEDSTFLITDKFNLMDQHSNI